MKNMKNSVVILILALVIVLGFLWFGRSGKPLMLAPQKIELTLAPQNAFDVVGTAILAATGGQTKVTINLTKDPIGGSHPAHIHVGACPKPGEVKYALTPVVNGASETTLPVSVAEIVKNLPLAVNLHFSAGNVATYIACADIKLGDGAMMDKGDNMVKPTDGGLIKY